jgi:hypothetical protein
MVGSTPCFEGLLLSILGKRLPTLSSDCKKAIAQQLRIDLTERQSYAEYFSKVVLDVARETITELDQLLRFFEGR